jgi:hypothetical protein
VSVWHDAIQKHKNLIVTKPNQTGSHGGFWDIGADNNLYANNKNPIKFSIELMANNRLLIKAPNGFYLKGEQNGNVSASAENVKQATHWEF